MVVTPVLTNGQIVKQAETDLIIAALRAWQQLVLDLLTAQQACVIPGGFTLTAAAGTPIKVNYAAGVVILSGYDLPVASGQLTLGAADASNHRYDLLTVPYTQPSGTDSAGSPTKVDTAAPTVIAGTPAGSPVLPLLPAGSAQLGWVDVPPNVTSATQCVLHQVQGPLVPNNLQDLTTHLAAVITSSTTVHGIRQGSGNGLDSDTVDGLHAAAFDVTGAAGAVQTNLGTEVTNRTNADSTHAALSEQAQQVHGLMVQRGTTGSQTVVNQTEQGYSITFPVAFPGVPTVVASISGTYGQQYGSQVLRQSVSATGATFNVGQTSGGNVGIALDWIAVY